ncbi:MAG: hypothetical protein K2W96_17345 [Gemmataceae bacterium]|nr:hypothetical protein [Gemmataceae bacterium]
MPLSSGSEEEDQASLARGYNNSIYLMLLVPYSALGLLGWMVYRQLRARAALMASLPPGPEPFRRDPGASPCPAFVPVGTSSPPPA